MWVSHLNPNANLEDKVRAIGEGDVTVVIYPVEAGTQFEGELQINSTMPRVTTQQEDHPIEPDPDRPRRTRRSTQHSEFSYD